MADLPILKYIDILIGLAVVMLLASTIVTAISQMVLSSIYARARCLREGLQELIGQIDRSLSSDQARYVTERILRHPLLGRPNGVVGWISGRLRNWGRQKLGRIPLPPVNPANAVLREELILILLEWAANQGPLREQDSKLAHPELPRVLDALRQALANNGVPDPAGTLSAIQRKAIENEKANPQQPATQWRSDAIIGMAPCDLVAKINAWFDNLSARVTSFFALQARAMTSVVALLLCVAVQLDSLGLVRRLSVDDKFRDALVAQAEQVKKQAEDAQKKAGETKDDAEKAKQQNVIDRAHADLEQISATLAPLREPKLALVPSYFAWEKLETVTVPTTAPWPSQPDWQLELVAGSTTYPIQLPKPAAGRELSQVAQLIRDTGAPVAVYARGDVLKLVAQRTDIDRFQLKIKAGQELSQDNDKRIDVEGLRSKMPGILFSWILLSLGTPFWYDLLKNLLNLRSMVAKKDDRDRADRQAAQTASTQAGGASASGGTAPAQTAAAAAAAAGEAGDLAATGGAG